jgi:hypothetical protein
MRANVLPSLLLIALLGCGERDVSDHPSFTEKPERKRDQSNIVRVETPVAPGVQIPCDGLLDVDEVSAMLGEEVTIRDRNSTRPDATSMCAIHRSGEPPSAAVQKRRSEESGILGVLPGDELCTIEARCSTPSSLDGLVDRCQQRGDELNNDLGMPACVHRTQRGPRWAYTYRVFDSASLRRCFPNGRRSR